MNRKWIALLLTLLLASGALAGCSEENSNPSGGQQTGTTNTGEQQTDSAEETEPTPNLPDETLNGYTFRILTRDTDHHIKEVYAAEMNGEAVNDAVYTRNLNVEEKYNVKLEAVEVTESPENVMSDEFRRSVMANEDAFDVALMHTVMAGATALEGTAYNWNDVEYVDFTKPWWNSVIAEELNFDGKLYLAVSDYCISAIDYTWAMLYNRNLAADYQIDDLYSTVESGKWTYDTFYSLASMTSADLNGDGVMNYNDQYGFISHFNSATLNWAFAFDMRYIVRDNNGVPTLLPQSEKMADIVDKIYNLYFTGDTALYMSDAVVSQMGEPSHDLAVANTFANDRSLFAALRIYVINELRDMDSEFGIIPFPKYDESQEAYYTHVDGHAPLMILPKTLSDSRSAGIVLEALAYESYKEVVPAVYEIVLQSKYARDEASSRMLDLILDGRIYTFGYIYDDYKGMQWTLRDLMMNQSNGYASYYASKLNTAEAQLKKIIESYQAIDG